MKGAVRFEQPLYYYKFNPIINYPRIFYPASWHFSDLGN